MRMGTQVSQRSNSACTLHQEHYTNEGVNDTMMEEGGKGSALLKMRELFVLISGEC